MSWAGHVARIGERSEYTGFWCGNLRERDHLGDPEVDNNNNNNNNNNNLFSVYTRVREGRFPCP